MDDTPNLNSKAQILNIYVDVTDRVRTNELLDDTNSGGIDLNQDTSNPTDDNIDNYILIYKMI